MPQKNNLKIIESDIKKFLQTKTGHTIKSVNDDLVKKGIISSFTMFELIDFIEKNFKLKVDILEINPDNFNCIKNITKQINIWISK